MIRNTWPAIAARADFPIVCSCAVDGEGRRRHPPHEPSSSGWVLFVSERVAVLFYFLAYCTLHVSFSRNSCAAVEFLIETQLENRSAQALFISLIAWW